MIRPLSDSLPIQLLAVHDAVMRYFRPMLQQFGMTDQQWRVLRVIAQGEVDFRDLAKACLIQPASLSRMLDLLSERGWVDRRAGQDRRQRMVSLTAKGRAQFDAAAAETERLYQVLEADLGQDYAPSIAMLNRLLERLDAAHADQASQPSS